MIKRILTLIYTNYYASFSWSGVAFNETITPIAKEIPIKNNENHSGIL